MKIISLIITMFSLISGLKTQVLVKDFHIGPQSSNPVFIDSVGDGFLLYCNNSTYGREMYFANGSFNNAILLKDIYAGGYSSNVDFTNVKMGGKVYFIANDGSSVRYGLWKTDGTKAGTAKVKSLSNEAFPQNYINSSNTNKIGVFKDRLFLTVKNEKGLELWVSDGTDSGTFMLKDIYPGESSGNPRGYIVLKDHLYFIANDQQHGDELWRTDGTEEGTELFYELLPGAGYGIISQNPQMFVLKDKLYFKGFRSDTEKEELFVTDGTVQGTGLFKDFNTKNQFSSKFNLIAKQDDYVIFNTTSSNNEAELWKFDGTDTNGLVNLLRINSTAFFLQGFNFGKKVIFPALINGLGYEYWITDGTEDGTRILEDMNPGTGSGYAGFHTVIGNRIYMLVQSSNQSLDIWTSNGTQDSTYILYDLPSGVIKSYTSGFFNHRNKLYALMKIEDHVGQELYRFNTNKNLSISEKHPMFKNIYPNPVCRGAKLNIDHIEEVLTCRLIGMIGNTTCILETDDNKIDIPNQLVPGLYILEYQTEKQIFKTIISVVE